MRRAVRGLPAAAALRALRRGLVGADGMATVQPTRAESALMSYERRQFLEVLVALSPWVALILALAWSAVRSSESRGSARALQREARRPDEE